MIGRGGKGRNGRATLEHINLRPQRWSPDDEFAEERHDLAAHPALGVTLHSGAPRAQDTPRPVTSARVSTLVHFASIKRGLRKRSGARKKTHACLFWPFPIPRVSGGGAGDSAVSQGGGGGGGEIRVKRGQVRYAKA